MSSGEHEFSFNGINGTTGRALIPRLSTRDVARFALGEKWEPGHLANLQQQKDRVNEDELGMIFGESAKRLWESGWGVIFPQDMSLDIKRSLAPLLEHRQREASRHQEHLYRELVYIHGESKPRFLARHKVGPGPVDPHQLPYYLLIVGSPKSIPFHFQYQLDVQYAVGRIHFDDPASYGAYARSVVEAEAGPAVRSPRMSIFGPSNSNDKPTARSLRNLVQPVAEHLSQTLDPLAQRLGQNRWTFETVAAEEATKEKLSTLIGGPATPTLLFTASHGMGFESNDPRLRRHQGALLCQDWPGPRAWREPIPTDHYFSADDIGDQADLGGLIAFHFACFGAGTPEFDNFAHRGQTRRRLAAESFVARLPQRLLGHPRGGALAVVGHVDRAWSYSFDWKGGPQQIGVFTSVFESLFEGYPLGAAMEFFNQRYAELSSDLSAAVEQANEGFEADFMSLTGMWTANNDARSYVVLGDPAVRLTVAETEGSSLATT